MSPSDREEAQRRRAESRRRRREGGAQEQDAPAEEPSAAAEGHDALRQAAKVAAAGAAVGAAVGAATRALKGHDGREGSGGDAAAGDDPAEQQAADGPAEQDAHAGTDEQVQDEPDESPEAGEEQDEQPQQDEPEAEPQRPRPQAREQEQPEPVRGAALDESLEVVRRAREHVQALQGHEAESVSSLERTSDGWRVVLEVVELERVPDSTDVMASYEVVLDAEKNVGRYGRLRRYYRAQADRGDA